MFIKRFSIAFLEEKEECNKQLKESILSRASINLIRDIMVVSFCTGTSLRIRILLGCASQPPLG